MFAKDLRVGNWVRCDYHGKRRFGCVEEKRFARYGSHDGWLVKTEDGYRYLKIQKMQNVELVG